MVENVAGGLLDVAARLDEPPEVDGRRCSPRRRACAGRYEALWELLHDEPVVGLADRYRVEATHPAAATTLGFAVDEVRLERRPAMGTTTLRLNVAVGGRRFHADAAAGAHRARRRGGPGHASCWATCAPTRRRLRARTRSRRARARSPPGAGWSTVFTPGVERAHEAVRRPWATPIQAYCDLLEVRWLLSEQAGLDVGDEPALEALAERALPADSAADLSFVDLAANLRAAGCGPGPIPTRFPGRRRRLRRRSTCGNGLRVTVGPGPASRPCRSRPQARDGLGADLVSPRPRRRAAAG